MPAPPRRAWSTGRRSAASPPTLRRWRSSERFVVGDPGAGGDSRDHADSEIVAQIGGVDAVVPGGDRGRAGAVSLDVTGGEELLLGHLLDPEAVDEVPRPDQLVVARRGRPGLALLADAAPCGRRRSVGRTDVVDRKSTRLNSSH